MIKYGGKVPAIPKVGGMVSIKSRVGDVIVSRRVPIAPAFDPDAISMVPIPGWKAPVSRGLAVAA